MLPAWRHVPLEISLSVGCLVHDLYPSHEASSIRGLAFVSSGTKASSQQVVVQMTVRVSKSFRGALCSCLVPRFVLHFTVRFMSDCTILFAMSDEVFTVERLNVVLIVERE